MLNAQNAQRGAGGNKSYQTTIDDILAEAEKRLEGSELSNQPEVRAELRQVIGAGYLDVGNYAAAERNLRQALTEQTRIYGEGSPKLLKTEFGLARLFLAKADYDNAEKIFGQRFSSLRTAFQQGTIEAEFFIVSLSNYGILRRARGDSLQAEILLRESLALSSQYSLKAQGDMAGSVRPPLPLPHE